MTSKLKEVLRRAQEWSPEDQDELAELALLIESRRRGIYHASAGELATIDEADVAEVASPEEVSEAFKAFRRG